MHEKISKQDKAVRDKELERALEKSWAAFRNAILRGNKKSRDKSAGDFLLAFAQFAQTTGIHAEMALRSASDKFEKNFRLSEKKS
jgi:uncharacterized protein YabN with tetrapyrrole methylase and pyrophosphatase domain